MNYPEIAQRVFHTPLLAAPAKAAGFVTGLGPRLLGTERIEIAGLETPGAVAPSAKPYASLLDDRLGDEIRAGRRDAYRMLEGAAVIPITGTLIHRGAWVGSYSGETSYEGIGAQLDAALEDRSVRGIALEIDSHGGEVAGCFDLADRIRAAREIKPVWAFVCDHAFSAAYALAAQTDRLVLPRSGGVGSIGVICLHADTSQRLEELGVQVTVISAGAHKADGNPYAPLPADVRASLQGEMEALRTLFAETVAAGREERLSAAAVLATEAGCFLGQDAVEAGLADEVANPRAAFERFIAQINGQSDGLSTMATRKGPQTMSKDINNAGTAKAETPEVEDETPVAEAQDNTEATENTAVADGAADKAPAAAASAGGAPAPAAGAADEKQRIAAILSCPEAVGREDLAQSLALNSDMSAAEAKTHLAAAAKAAPARALSAEMDQADTDLGMPAGAAPTENLVKAAQKERWN